MTKARTTLSIDAEVLRATRIAAARTGRHDSAIVEEALRAYLGLSALDRAWAAASLTSEEADELAYRELHASRDS